MPPLAGAIAARIDGRRSIAEIRDDLAATRRDGLDDGAFESQFAALYAALNGFSKLFLRG